MLVEQQQMASSTYLTVSVFRRIGRKLIKDISDYEEEARGWAMS